MNPLYPDVSERAGKRCEYCHAPETTYNFLFEVEHIQPLAERGRNDLDNLALSCRSCNLFKSTRRSATDPETGEAAPLFNPRTQTWTDHFDIDAGSLELVGLTPTGRATIAALRMNSPEQQDARRQRKRLDLFP